MEHSIIEETGEGEGTLYLWYNNDREYRSYPADRWSADLSQRIPTYEDVLALERDSITDTGYEEKSGTPCIYVEVEDPELHYRQRYWVSVSDGLLVAAETVKDGQVVLSASASGMESTEGTAFTLPDGSPIPEYEFLPEDWGTWPDMDTLLLTVGRGGDAGEPHTYRCTVRMNQDGTLSGSALEQTTEVLSEDYDFDHDGMPETTELVTVLTPETDYYPAWYILQVIRQDGVELWSAGAHPSHAGWTSVFACKIDGEDYLLQYEPEMYQGWAEYAYELWAFDGNGQAYTSDNRSVTFDINFGREEHQFDPEAIAGFFWELRGLLQDSILLASTENGEFQTGIPGLELQNYIFSDLLSLDSLEAMEASVRQQEAELGAA